MGNFSTRQIKVLCIQVGQGGPDSCCPILASLMAAHSRVGLMAVPP